MIGRPTHLPPGQRCDHRWKGHACRRNNLLGDHLHQCNCGAKALSRHAFHADPYDDQGRCWCGRPETDLLHRPAVAA